MKNRGSWVLVKDGISMSFLLLCHTKNTGLVRMLDLAKANWLGKPAKMISSFLAFAWKTKVMCSRLMIQRAGSFRLANR